jgi:cytochrome c553
MKTESTFPLPWEQVLWSSAPTFPLSWSRPGTKYAFTDFRLVVERWKRTVDELALHDIDSVCLSQAWWQRIAGTSTVRVYSRRTGSALELANIHHGPQLALILQLRATELFGDGTKTIDADFFRSALGPRAASILHPHRGFVLAATLVFGLVFGIIGLARNSSLPPIVYTDDDPISPHGSRRSSEAIAVFMEREVMPFARRALGPLVGGADNVTCETCHGSDARQRHWRMPGVRALPEPELRLAGLERARLWLDPQIRNAVYGYLAEEDKQSVAAYMRQVVMPGMARLMHRPAYDFAQSYGYNRSRAAVGCYHCHLVE